MLLSRRAAAALLAASLVASLATAQEPAPPPLAIEEIVIEPAAPTATTLCRLRLKLKNSGSEPASMLRFKVTVAGHELPRLPQPDVPAAARCRTGHRGLKLYNFWASETGRPAPADGKMAVEVTLTEAKWMKVGPDASGVETWEPLGSVPCLPLAKSVTVTLKR